MLIMTTTLTATSMSTAEQRLRLMQLASSNLPVGGYSWSQGLEWAVEAGWVPDVAAFERERDGLLLHGGGHFIAQTRHGVDHHQRAQLAAGEHIVADGQFLVDAQVECALVDALVVAAEQQQLRLARELLDDALVELPPARGEVDAPGAVFRVARGDRVGDRLGGHHHARAAAVRIIVHMPVLVRRVFPDIYSFNRNQSILRGSADDAGVKAV